MRTAVEEGEFGHEAGDEIFVERKAVPKPLTNRLRHFL